MIISDQVKSMTMRRKTGLILPLILSYLCAVEVAYGFEVPEPYQYEIFFDSFSVTPTTDQLMALDDLGKEIREKRPVRITLTGYARADEVMGTADSRNGYVRRWLKMTVVPESCQIDTETVRQDSLMTGTGGDEWHKVTLSLYDQRMIFARQDAERRAKKMAMKKPKLHVPGKIYEFGTVLEGDPVFHTFRIRNVGEADLEIKRVSSNCGCTTVDYTKRLRPSEAGIVKVKVDTGGNGNNLVKRKIQVTTNDPEQTVTDLIVAGTVERFAEVSPKTLMLSGRAGRQIERIVKILPSKKYSFRILGAVPDDARIECFIDKPDDTGVYRLRVRTTGEQKGRFKYRLKITTDSSLRPEIDIPVVVKIR